MRTREMQSMTQFLQVKADGWVSVKEHQFYYWDDDRYLHNNKVAKSTTELN